MPHTVNGIGTWYVGKRNVHRLKAVCEFCRSLVQLESYDTTLCFVVIYLPLIPLSRKRILGDCPKCRRHRVMPLKEWERQKAADGEAYLRLLADQPDTPAAAQAGLSLAAKYQDQALFEKTAATLSPAAQADADVQAFLADCHAYFGQRAEAADAYRRALALKDDPAVREQLALALLRLGKPSEAEETLKPLFAVSVVSASDDPGRSRLASLLAEGYQAVGDHDAALRVLDEAEAKAPHLAADPDFKKKRKLSEKLRVKGRPLHSDLFSQGKGGYREWTWVGVLGFSLSILGLLGMMGLYLGRAWWLGENQQLLLVNGLDRPYAVLVRGQKVTLPPHTPMGMRVPEGQLEVAAADNTLPLGPVRCTIETNFFSRPFASPVFIVNPDQTALLELHEVEYTEHPQPGAVRQPETFTGRDAYVFHGIDYLFVEAPQQIQMQKGSTVRKKQLLLVSDLEPRDRVELARANPDPEARRTTLKRLANLAPDEPAYLEALAQALKPTELNAFVKTKLADRPIRVEWHLLHQKLAQSQPHAEKGLAAEYAALVKETQGAPDALALKAELEEGAAAEELLRRAAAAQPPSAYARYALGLAALSAGRFAEAEAEADKAIRLQPHQRRFRDLRKDALLAQRKFALLLETDAPPPAPGAKYADRLRAQLRRVDLLAAMGEAPAAQETRQAILQELPAAQKAMAPMLAIALDARTALAKRDEAAYLKAIGGAEDGKGYAPLLLQGKLAEAAFALEGDEEPARRPWRRGLVCLFAQREKEEKIAADQFDDLIDELKKGDRREAAAAALLDSKTPDVAKLKALSLPPAQKGIALRLAAARFPESAGDLLPLARQLNFALDEDALLLQRLDRN